MTGLKQSVSFCAVAAAMCAIMAWQAAPAHADFERSQREYRGRIYCITSYTCRPAPEPTCNLCKPAASGKTNHKAKTSAPLDDSEK